MPKNQPMNPKGTVLITGAAKRIGKAIAIYLANQGYNIAVHYNNSHQDAQNVANCINNINKEKGHCETFRADFSDFKAVYQLIPKVYKKFPDLQFLVNNASIFNPSNIQNPNLADFDEEIAVNLRAPFVLTSQFAKLIQKGKIVNILDTNITKNKTSYLSYLLSKKSLADLTRLTAIELAPRVQVNAVAPGLILAPKLKNTEYLDRLAKNIPSKRRGDPQDIAKTVHFLLENPFITGQAIFVDGGEHLL